MKNILIDLATTVAGLLLIRFSEDQGFFIATLFIAGAIGLIKFEVKE